MEITMRKLSAILQKEIKLFAKNKNVLLISLLPAAFSIIYSNIFSDQSASFYIFNLCISINMVLVAAFVMAMMIAEEKDKNTLRTLMLSGISPVEFLFGKMIITLIITFVSNIIIFVIFAIDTSYLGSYLLITIPYTIIMLIIGAIIGILSPNQMSTGVVGMPVLMIFFMLPSFAELNKTLRMIAKFIPGYAVQLLLEPLLNGQALGKDVLFNILVIIGWFILSILAFIFTFHKVGLDK
jgi:ABC-2 type transport system permease protein